MINRIPADCAANGGPTISRVEGCIDDEMLECIVCRNSSRWDTTEHPFFGFKESCPHREQLEQEVSR
jgi:hypothetical protein